MAKSLSDFSYSIKIKYYLKEAVKPVDKMLCLVSDDVFFMF